MDIWIVRKEFKEFSQCFDEDKLLKLKDKDDHICIDIIPSYIEYYVVTRGLKNKYGYIIIDKNMEILFKHTKGMFNSHIKEGSNLTERCQTVLNRTLTIRETKRLSERKIKETIKKSKIRISSVEEYLKNFIQGKPFKKFCCS